MRQFFYPYLPGFQRSAGEHPGPVHVAGLHIKENKLMFRNFQEIENQAKKIGPRRAVALFPDDPDVMRAMADGKKLGLIEPILVGDRSRIQTVAHEVSMFLEGVEILDIDDPQKAADLCLKTVVNGQASFIIKGNILTTYLYRSLIRIAGSTDVSMQDIVKAVAENIRRADDNLEPLHVK